MHSAAKVLKFPLSGIARDIDYRKAYIPEEEVQFATPFALNVRGSDTFHRRNRGGSRPGLTTVDYVVSESTGKWLWPNGEPILWDDGANMTFTESSSVILAPDGSRMVDVHAKRAIKGLAVEAPTITTFYRNRAVCAKGSQWYMSAIGDVTDWDFGKPAEDASRAVSGNVSLAGVSGEDITAIIPIRDAALYVATKRSVWVISGDPTSGTIKCVSENVGCVSRDAWCFDGAALWVLSNQGLYRIGVGEMPVRASHHIPEEFRGTSAALLAYDPEEDAIHIFSEKDVGSATVASDWFYDIGNKAFWRQAFKAAHRPSAICTYLKDGVNVLAFKGGDNTWRVFDDEADSDSGETFASHVAIGPVRCSARDDMDGMVAEIEATLAVGSADSLVSVYTAHSPEQAVKTAYDSLVPVSTFAVKSGWNNVCRPRQRGAWAVFVVSSTGRWGFESMTTVAKQFGRLR